jgi:nucleoside-triphosphatase
MVPGQCWRTSIWLAPPRVGKYGVDVVAFERFAVPALSVSAWVVVVDELGKMELASAAFRESVRELFARPFNLVATVHAFAHPVTDGLKAPGRTSAWCT